MVRVQPVATPLARLEPRMDPEPSPAPAVLLAEAHEDSRELYALWLSQRGFRVRGVATADALAAEVRRDVPDVVVLELMLPGGGLHVLRALRQTPATAGAVVIVLTTQSNETLRQLAIRAGADAYILKPCGAPQLGQVMLTVSRQRAAFAVGPDAGAARRALAIAERVDAPRAPSRAASWGLG